MPIFDFLYIGVFRKLIHIFNLNGSDNTISTEDPFMFTPVFLMDWLPSFNYDFSFIFKYTFFLIFFFTFFAFLFPKTLNSMYITLSEKNFNGFDDLIMLIIVLFSFYFSYVFYILGVVLLLDYEDFFTLFMFILVCIVSSILFLLIWDMGVFFLHFINGSGKYSNLLLNLLVSYLHLLVFHLRMFVQLSRIIVISATYYGLVHLSNDLSYNYLYISDSQHIYPCSTLTDYVFMYLRFSLEIAHTMFIFLMQAFVFGFMILWLVQFLFTTIFSIDLEKIKNKKTSV